MNTTGGGGGGTGSEDFWGSSNFLKGKGGMVTISEGRKWGCNFFLMPLKDEVFVTLFIDKPLVHKT